MFTRAGGDVVDDELRVERDPFVLGRERLKRCLVGGLDTHTHTHTTHTEGERERKREREREKERKREREIER